MLRRYVRPDQQNWGLYLSLAEFSMNNCYKSSTQRTPFQMVHGKHPITPASAHMRNLTDKNPSAQFTAKQVHEHLDQAKECMLAAQSRDKHYSENRTRPLSFEVAQRVLLSTKNLHLKKSALTRKLTSRFIGPFESCEQSWQTSL